MAEIKDYGELYTSDILIVGGGMAGLVTAIRAKENDPTLDILVVIKGLSDGTDRLQKPETESVPHPSIRMA